MLRFLIGLLFLSSCSLGVVKSGGDRTYAYDVHSEYSVNELEALAPEVVTTLSRDPQEGKLADLFSQKQKPIKRVGILVFESTIQPTRGGLSNEDKIFLSEQGKQLITEKLLTIWEQSFPILGKGIEFIKVSDIKGSKSFKSDGMDVEDYIKSRRSALAPDDIFFLPSGKKTATQTVMSPRGMRDLSLALVPASDLMGGPKFSEHAKHTLNQVASELNLDAMFVVMSKIHWTASRIDKHSGEIIPEEVIIELEASTLVSLSQYRERLNNIGIKNNVPKTTIAFRTYQSQLKVPVNISVPKELENFEYIEEELLDPTLKTYNDLTQMLQMRMIKDIKTTNK